MSQALYKQILDYISDGKMSEGIALLVHIKREFHASTSSRFKELEGRYSRGILSEVEYTIERNRIREGIIKFLESLQETFTNTKVGDDHAEVKKVEGAIPMFKDDFLERLEAYFRANSKHAYIEMKLNILSLEYIRKLSAKLLEAHDKLDAGNFHKLIQALDQIKEINNDLLEILGKSGNNDSDPYDAACIVSDQLKAVRALLETLSEDQYQLNVAISKLKRAITRLIKRMKDKEEIALPFSLN